MRQTARPRLIRGFTFNHLMMLSLALFLSACEKLPRGPYLQNPTTESIVVKWRTDDSVIGQVAYGLSANNLNQVTSPGGATTNHEVTLTGLLPDTTYYYQVINDEAASADVHSFITPHDAGDDTPFRVWLIGDSGTADANAAAVRDAFYDFNGGPQTDLWIMLGDNAYTFGTDNEYQRAVFDMYPDTLSSTPLYSTIGNHEVMTTGGAPYYDIFTLPTTGEAGGIPSGTEAYYSFDYGNVHFICLDSEKASRAVNGAMYTWLETDLQANTQDWTVVFFHQPPYSKGSHDSDDILEYHIRDMRENFTPLFDQYGVDFVFNGHSHAYERSYPIAGHTGKSRTFEESMKVFTGDGREDGDGAYQKMYSQIQDSGVIYTVAGSSGKISDGTFDHPVHYISLKELGSVVLDFNGDRVDTKFITPTQGVRDYYTVEKF
ncbi:MAG: metallophosphoesterase family protein [Ketobacteraceae bacterium]|nr:metallophosphoesterase family protein [Ketobacteraceae bacterium]